MTRQVIFRRKIAYIVAVAVLLIPLYMLGIPATQKTPGGQIARLRDEHKIGQANLGEIDPTSVAVRLSTLGLSGVAVTILSGQANEFKKTENWTEYENTLDEILKLQPNFSEVWRHQAWNLSYNVSVEFDDFRSRYLWVKKGIQFLIKGSRYNDQDQRLLWDVGWFITQKIGKSDEQDQFRRMFKNDMRQDDQDGDDSFRDIMPFALDVCEDPRGDRDNWLVGREWYRMSQRLVDEKNVALRMNPTVFHSSPPMSQIKYAAALIEDGIFDREGEPIRQAWREAQEQWDDYGNRSIMTSKNFPIRLNDLQRYEDRLKEQEAQLAKLEAEGDAADRATVRALEFEIEHLQEKVRLTRSYRKVVNFKYWKDRCEYEQMPEAAAAHRLAYEARQAYERAEFVKAVNLYEECFKNWRVVLDRYKDLVEQHGTIQDVGNHIGGYQDVLEQLERPLPRGFILQDVVDQAMNPDGKRLGGS